MRKILDELEFRNEIPEENGGGGEALRLYILGPSDNGKHQLPKTEVVRLEWRSPMGDDLRVEVGRDWLINAISRSE